MKRLEAAAAGEKFFNSLNPCKRCGAYQRYTINGVCVTCAKDRSRREHEHYRSLLALAKAQGQV